MSIAERIDTIIKKRGISRRKLALTAGISPSTLQSAMERNKGMSVEMVEKIAAALELSVSELVGYSPRTGDKLTEDTAFSSVLSRSKQFSTPISDVELLAALTEDELFAQDLERLERYYDKLNHNNRVIVAELARLLASQPGNCLADNSKTANENEQ